MSVKQKQLKDFLPLESNETGILITWNRMTGEVALRLEGLELHITSAIKLFTDCVTLLKQSTNKDGICCKKQEDEPEENNDMPDWLD